MKYAFSILSFLLLTFYSSAQPTNFNPPPFHSLDTTIKAMGMYEREAYDSALALYNQVHPGDSSYVDILIEKVKSLAQAEDYEQAIAACEEGISLNKGYESAFLNLLAIVYGAQEKYDKSLETYGRALKKFPSAYRLYFTRGEIYESMERYTDALNDYKTAIELNPYHFSSHKNLAALALNDKKYTQALMSLGYCVLIDPDNENINNMLMAFDQAVTADFEYDPKDLDLDKEEKYKTDLMVKSYIALEDDYEIDTDINFGLIRQMHLVLSQLKKRKIGDGFWENYYAPFYQAMMEEDLFEEFSHMMAITSGNEYHQKVISSNSSSLKKFVEWSKGKLAETHNHHHKNYDPDLDKVRFFYHDDSWDISAIGDINSSGTPYGPFVFFYKSGAKASEGKFNKKGERDGKWVTYHENSDTSRVAYYEDGLLEGPSREYHNNGNPSVFASYKADEPHGIAEIFNRHGIKTRQMSFDEGEIKDTLYYYYSDGSPSGAVPYQNNKAQGQATYYNEDGSLLSKIDFADDSRHGKGLFYYYNKAAKAEAEYVEGDLHGPYKSYYSNGQLESEGQYIEGIKSGTWKTYNPLGLLVGEESYDEKGKQSGIDISYDNSGRKVAEFEYSRGEIKAYRLFDISGEIIHQDKEKWGKFYFENYNIYGNKVAEGHYHGDHKEGPWIFYNGYGVKDAEEFYNEEGQLNGETQNFHSNGQIASVYNYENGELNGYYVKYFDHGIKAEEGWYAGGEQESFYRTYNFDGSLESEGYYVNDDINGPRTYFDEEGQPYLRKYFDLAVLYKTENIENDSVYRSSVFRKINSPDLSYYPNGQVRYNISSAGNMYNGTGKWYYGNGQLQTVGNYENGYYVGEWKWYHPNGELSKIGNYGLNEKIGTWKEYHDNGKLKAVYTYVEGERHGEYIDYFENGEISDKGEYYLGDLHGKRHFYQDDGTLNHVRIYDHGRIIGYIKKPDAQGKGEIVEIKDGTADVKSFYANGKPAREYKIVKGDFQGPYREHNLDGSLAYEAEYKDDNQVGIVKTYDHNGTLRKMETRVDGYLHGISETYHANGQLKMRMNYITGSLNGECPVYDENGELLHTYLYRTNLLIDEI